MIVADPNCYEIVIGEITRYVDLMNDQLNHIQSILPEADRVLVGDVVAEKAAANLQKNMEQLRVDLNYLYAVRAALQEEWQAIMGLPTFIP